MRILVLGGAGMLGHKMYQVLRDVIPDTWCTVRQSRAQMAERKISLLTTSRVIYSVDVLDHAALIGAIRGLEPDVTVNCVGSIKQRSEANDPLLSIGVNSLLPHRLAAIVRDWSGRVIHFSTDCVFSGTRGNYTEDDPSDATDLYGRTKSLGELSQTSNALTLRTSIIGRELYHHMSLLEWFLAQKGGLVKGYSETWWSGVTTTCLAQLVGHIVVAQPHLNGLYHLSSGRISKYQLLTKLNAAYGLETEIVADSSERCDRSLDGTRLAGAIAWTIPSLDSQIEALAHDPTPYEEWTR